MVGPSGSRFPSGVVALVAAATAARLVYAGALPLSPDEAYYWSWSRDLSLAYPDHPPLIAWLIRAGTLIAGENPLGVRLITVLLGAASLFAVHSLARACGLDRRASLLATALIALLPATATGSLLATPDGPLGLAWILSATALVRLSSGGSHGRWYVLGAVAGPGLWAKHSGLLIPLLTAAAVVAIPQLCARLRAPHPWLAAALAAVLVLPLLIVDRGSWGLQLSHLSGGLPAGGDPVTLGGWPGRAGALLAGQLGLITPFVAWFAARHLWRKREAPGPRVLALGTIAPLLAALIAAAFTHPEQNWASLGHPLLAVAAAAALTSASALPGRRRPWAIVTCALAVVVTVTIHVHAARPFLPLPPERDPVSRLHGWDSLDALAPEVARFDAVVCDNYGLAAELAWSLRGTAPDTIVRGADRPPSPPPGDWLLLDERSDWGNAPRPGGCAAIEEISPLELRRADGALVRTIDRFSGTRCAASAHGR